MTNRNIRFKTPKALLPDHVTPLRLEFLRTYTDMTTLRVLEIEETRRDERGKSMIFQAGTRARPIPVRHARSDRETLLEQREAAADALRKDVKAALKIAKKSKMKIVDGVTDKPGISLKHEAKIDQKAETEYDGDYARVVDMVRCTILAGDIADLQALSEVFRPCAMPEVIRYKNEFSRINTDRGGVRRLLINKRQPSAGGHATEIQVYYGPSAEKYDISREAYGTERAARQAEQKAILRGNGHQTTTKVTRMRARASQARIRANEEAGAFPEIRNLIMHQRAFLINEFPVIVNEDAHTGMTFSLAPNPATGFWETDQRFLDIIENHDEFPEFKIWETTPFDAAVRAQALCENAELQEQLRNEM